MPLVLTVFCNLFFKLTLAGLHVLTLNQSLYLSIFFLLRLLFWRIHPDHPRWTAGFFFSLRTQRWTEECWGTLCLSVLVWHKRGSVCPTMHCLVSSFVWREHVSWWLLSSSGLKPSISPFGCLRVSPVRRLPSAFWFAPGTAGPVDLLIPQKTFLPPIQHEPTEVY